MKSNITRILLLSLTCIHYNIQTADLLHYLSGPLLRPILEKNRIVNKNAPSSNDPSIVNPNDITEDFNSVILSDNIKSKFKIIVEFTKNPDKFYKIGAKPPKGVLLYGLPGTGKTTLGRALAKEANAKFLYIAGSELDGMYVGDGASRIKSLFALAREHGPAIIFIDEIDTIAKKRGALEGRFHAQTVQQLLIEMDGFKQNQKPIVVVGTTNNINHLDKALLRSGRFDIHLEIPTPDALNRRKILSKYLAKIKISNKIDEKCLTNLCQSMDNFSGADIENMVNQATLNAITQGREVVELMDFNKAIEELKQQKD